MKSVFFFLFSLVYIFVNGQEYKPFLIPGKKWTIYYTCVGPCGMEDAEVKYEISGDTIINDTNYYKLIGEVLWSPEYTYIDHPYLAALMREDTIKKKVYMLYDLDIYSTYTWYKTEKIFFDFSLSVGDTLKSYSHFFSFLRDKPIDMHVSSIDTIELKNGQHVRRYKEVFNSNLQTESIGSLQIFFEPRWINTPDIGVTKCVIENGENIYGNNCTFPTAILNNTEVYIKLFPTIMSDILFTESMEKEAEIQIYNSQGNEILRKKIYFGESALDVSFIPAGIYYYVIIANNKSRNGKIIKIN